MKAPLLRLSCCVLFLLALCCEPGCLLLAQAAGTNSNDDEVRGVIVLARHGVRAPIESEARGSAYNAQPWPAWPAAPGLVTAHGAEALRLLGAYYRSRYSELLDKQSCEHPGVYVEANTVPRTIASAKAVLAGLEPTCTTQVHLLVLP